jgi:hypothetical protein
MYKTFVDKFKVESSKHKILTHMSFLTFADYVDVKYTDKKVDKVTSFNSNAWGNTALLDATGDAINLALNSDDIDDEDTSFLIIVLTDGEENVSTRFNQRTLTALIKQAEKTGRITIAFHVPRGGKGKLVRFGISEDNICEWEQTSYGVREVEQKTSGGIAAYYSDRSLGLKSKANFFTDLSHVTKRDLNSLDDLSLKFKSFDVKDEDVIKSFVETKTHKPYIQGNAYYQLMKTEKLQAGKLILIQDKNTKKIYGGDEARELLGLDVGVEVKVIPGNHANYDIFIQSTSVNRILPRGTKVLVKK